MRLWQLAAHHHQQQQQRAHDALLLVKLLVKSRDLAIWCSFYGTACSAGILYQVEGGLYSMCGVARWTVWSSTSCIAWPLHSSIAWHGMQCAGRLAQVCVLPSHKGCGLLLLWCWCPELGMCECHQFELGWVLVAFASHLSSLFSQGNTSKHVQLFLGIVFCIVSENCLCSWSAELFRTNSPAWGPHPHFACDSTHCLVCSVISPLAGPFLSSPTCLRSGRVAIRLRCAGQCWRIPPDHSSMPLFHLQCWVLFSERCALFDL